MLMSNYEYVNSPSHYKNSDGREAIDIILEEFGIEETIIWCIITARKYELRNGQKPGESLERDMKKRDWYLNKANELKSIQACQQNKDC